MPNRVLRIMTCLSTGNHQVCISGVVYVFVWFYGLMVNVQQRSLQD